MDFEVFRIPTGEALDQVDAALFTGDEFEHPNARLFLREVIERWNRRLSELETEENVQAP